MAKQPYNPIMSTAKTVTGVAAAVVGSIVGVQLGVYVSNKILTGVRLMSRKVKAEYRIWNFKQELKKDSVTLASSKATFHAMHEKFLVDMDKPYTPGTSMDDWFGKGRF